MKDKTNAGAVDIAKVKSEKNPNEPKFTENQPSSSAVPKKSPNTPDCAAEQKPFLQKISKQNAPVEVQQVEDSKGNDDLKIKAPQSADEPEPPIDAHLKLALHETAQEEIHEVMTKNKAKNMLAKKNPKDHS